MSAREIHIELAIGRRVWAPDDRAIGRLEEVRSDDQWRITEYLIGTTGLLERLSVTTLSLFGIGRKRRGYRARWDQVDLRDVRRPRLTCRTEELQPLE
jgi:hypothetical protein